jgi:hypothetical protein
MAIDPVWKKRIYELCRKLQPASLRAHLTDGTIQELAVGGRRQKWQPLLGNLAKLAWTRLEFLDAKGRLQHAEEQGGPGELEEIGAGGGGAGSGFYREVRAQTALMLEAQGAAMEMVKPILTGYERVLHDLFEMNQQYRTDALEAVGETEKIVERIDRLLAARAGGETDESSTMAQVGAVLEMLPKLRFAMQMLNGSPPPARMPARPAAPRPTAAPVNGANGAAAKG